jgi:lactoylglutathione lyase
MQFSGTILYVRDVKKTLDWYGKAFGLKTRFLSEGGAYGDLELGSDLILGFASIKQSKENFKGGVLVTKKAGAPPAFEIGFKAEDVEGAYTKALKAGARSVAKPKKKPWGQTVAFLKDPDGHLIEISTPWAPPS